MTDWIDIKEEMPVIGEKVLLKINFEKKLTINANKRWPDRHTEAIRKTIIIGGERGERRFLLDLELELGIFSYTVTHWSYLPGKSKEEKMEEKKKEISRYEMMDLEDDK